LNEIFFGRYQNGWKYFHNKESMKLMRDYVNYTTTKYEHPTFSDQNEPAFFPAQQTYRVIKNNLDKEFSKEFSK
jgi:hypothetical protein